ncbi:hypothetical protein LSH36_387g02085 [Paralvinella palmiformis]|uniref:Disease resistance R13L4/SHOC-2-like LRR domain-containing protein n=1 Tax=Paralvinella palmiformis TaxID=53620 RepID=A0AAD9JCZ2_9ANNE|nr:hypothetical protein LSH36_387g02085 [Paralvinella palmiformis]
MPLFRKQSHSAKKRLQHQQYLAKESPEKTYDISDCELTDNVVYFQIPSGTYSVCKVLQKETLIAHTNWLSSLKGGGELKDLRFLRILDLHNNELASLPDDIGELKCLQVLNLDNNKLKTLPSSICCLTALQTLNVRGRRALLV